MKAIHGGGPTRCTEELGWWQSPPRKAQTVSLTCREEAQGNQGVPESVREEKISEELNEGGKIAHASQTSLFHRNGMQTL